MSALPPSAPRRPPILRFVFVALLVGLDLWSKAGIFAYLAGHPASAVVDAHGHERVAVIGNWLAVMRSLNPGMAFGLFGDSQTILVIGRLIAVVVLGWMLFKHERIKSASGGALVLVLAGALGNLYDNLFLGGLHEWLAGDGSLEFGQVRDFIDVYFGVWDYHFATFNVADSCITVGAVLLLFFWGRDEQATEQLAASASGE
jgi:signal peptidase II